MNRPSPIPTAPSRRGFLAVLSAGAASAVAPAALAAPLAPVTETPLLAPAVAILLVVLGTNVLGDALVDRLDPARPVADLVRDGMLTSTTEHRLGSARLTERGNWFARTLLHDAARGAADDA